LYGFSLSFICYDIGDAEGETLLVTTTKKSFVELTSFCSSNVHHLSRVLSTSPFLQSSMLSHPRFLPVVLLEEIIKLSFVLAGRREPSPLSAPPFASLLSVSKAVRLLALPYFFEVVDICDPNDWRAFFDLEKGIIVGGEEGERRWSWFKELVVPLLLPPFTNRNYQLGDASYLDYLTIPSSKRIEHLRYLPIPEGCEHDVNNDEERDFLLLRYAEGLDPPILED